MGGWGEFEPVVYRRDRLEVLEGTSAHGSIRTPLDLAAVRQAAVMLCAKAYANAGHEIAALAEIRAFERFSTTARNAYWRPEVSGHLDRLEKALVTGWFRFLRGVRECDCRGHGRSLLMYP